MSKNAGMRGALGVRIDDLAVTAARLLDPDRRCVTRTIFPGGGDGTHHTDPSAMCAAAAKALGEVGSESPGMDVKDVVFDLGPALAHSLSADSRARVGRVTAIRISPSPVSIQLPFASWPPGIRNRVDGGFVHMVGGTDLHGGQPLAGCFGNLRNSEIRAVAQSDRLALLFAEDLQRAPDDVA